MFLVKGLQALLGTYFVAQGENDSTKRFFVNNIKILSHVFLVIGFRDFLGSWLTASLFNQISKPRRFLLAR